MDMCKVRFEPHGMEVTVPEGTFLLRAALEVGVHINASCGGEGVCGKCRVQVEEGEVEGGESKRLRAEDMEKGYRLACQARVKSDCVIRVPVESSVDQSVLNAMAGRRKTAAVQETNLEKLKEEGLFIPAVEKKYVQLPPPSGGDNVSDISRLVNYLKIQQGEHRLVLDLSVIRKAPDVLREEDFGVTATISRPVRNDGRNRIINIQSGDFTWCNYGLAIDIGTTTVFGQLVDLMTGEILAQYGEFNKQISYGEDVINRIVYAEKPGGMDKLNEVVIETANNIIHKLIKMSNIDPDCISSVGMAGNTTMTQLLLRINPKYIRRSPFVPAANMYPPFQAESIGLDLPAHVTALVYPCVSSYVGGDIVAGVMGSGMYLAEELCLFIDIGTNAEIVVGNKDWMACAAASAGPAFEGGGVEHGMRAAKGAVEDFSVDPVTYEPMLVTIGNVRPRGICGSGLITMVATLFEAGIINNQGKFNRDLSTERIREREGVVEYVLSYAEQTAIDRDITLTEIDIENLIRAKGAMYAGYMTLLGEVGLTIDMIDRIYLAGGFGSYVDLTAAMTIGLLPETDPDKVTFVGNGSLMGSKMAILTNKLRQDVVQVTERMTNFELSETGSYMDNYVAALFLPHTDLKQFPRVKQRLDAIREARN
ncbi:MAG: ASKHA domain-containing protein [Desulfatibacillaceae bacterium]